MAETASGTIAVRLFQPRPGMLPALIYFPGGGWVLGDLDTHDAMCRIIANESGCAVISVNYRKAPEHPFPAAVHDAIATLQWIASRAADFDVDARRLAVGGDSAGANLATVAAMAIHAVGGCRFVWQLLLYPIVARPAVTGSYATYGRGYSLSAEAMRWFFEQYSPATLAHKVPDWWLTPSTAPNLAGLPDTLVIVAGCDPLRDEGICYARRLADAGVGVDLIEYHDQIHGFVNTGDAFPRAAEARSQIAAKLRAATAS
jgi:acetyl esterase